MQASKWRPQALSAQTSDQTSARTRLRTKYADKIIFSTLTLYFPSPIIRIGSWTAFHNISTIWYKRKAANWNMIIRWLNSSRWFTHTLSWLYKSRADFVCLCHFVQSFRESYSTGPYFYITGCICLSICIRRIRRHVPAGARKPLLTCTFPLLRLPHRPGLYPFWTKCV